MENKNFLKKIGERFGAVIENLFSVGLYDKAVSEMWDWHKKKATGEHRTSFALVYIGLLQQGNGLQVMQALYDRSNTDLGLPLSPDMKNLITEDKFVAILNKLNDEETEMLVTAIELLPVDTTITGADGDLPVVDFHKKYESQLRIIQMMNQNHLVQAFRQMRAKLVVHGKLGWAKFVKGAEISWDVVTPFFIDSGNAIIRLAEKGVDGIKKADHEIAEKIKANTDELIVKLARMQTQKKF